MWRLLCAGLLAVTPAPAPVPDIEDFLVERMHANQAPGLSYALVHGDRVVRSGAWGTDGYGRPMTPHTPVGFGSVAKPVTAIAVLRLVDAGRIGLDDPVVRHLPWFRLADQDAAREITVRHLLELTSGISARDGYDRSDIDDNAPGAIRRWVAGLADVTPAAAPGERHQYSPANAVIAGALLEEVSGLSFSDYVRREVFAPLDMADGVADVHDAERMPPGHEFYFGGVRTAARTFDMSGLPYGYLAGSATDLAHLAILQTDAGRFGDEQVLDPGTIAELQRGGPEAAGARYGLGWRVGTLDGTRIVWHAGAVTGYHSAVLTAPDEGWAVAVQQNVYSPLHDEALNSAAFGALTIALGGTPGPAPESSTTMVGLAGMGALALTLAGGLVWTVWRFRRCATGRRAVLATAGWVALGALSALAVGLWLPAAMDLRLRHIVRFMPDVGLLAIVVVVLGAALAVARLATLVVELRRR
ncbi:serine hydrolase [Actinophytocola sp.]|uniref:serine hydrolase domain-containing protein n=1 Tax=Actinophytocola sp. TaxID=1872138 RepID=UPI0025C02C46|nr:serine hydrolase domain-containing protein [Actinophytocola sp.]